MADFFELLSKRRSIRDYEDRVVSLDLVKEIVRDSCFAPSSGDGAAVEVHNCEQHGVD